MQNDLCLFSMLFVAAIAACQNSVTSVETTLVVDIKCPMSRFMHYAEVQACFVERALELTLQMQIYRNQPTRCRFGLKKGVCYAVFYHGMAYVNIGPRRWEGCGCPTLWLYCWYLSRIPLYKKWRQGQIQGYNWQNVMMVHICSTKKTSYIYLSQFNHEKLS